MKNPMGELKVQVGSKSYRLHLGMSALADLQERFGKRFDAVMTAAEPGKMPDLKVMHAIVAASLERHHPDADKWVADDIIRENTGVLANLLSAAFPDPDAEAPAPGEPKAAA